MNNRCGGFIVDIFGMMDAAARFRQVYLTSYLIGEGLSGFLPSLFALAQGVGGNPECNVTVGAWDASGQQLHQQPYYPPPRFSVSVFFAILFVMMLSSALAFIALNRSKVARNQQVGRLPDSIATLQVLSHLIIYQSVIIRHNLI